MSKNFPDILNFKITIQIQIKNYIKLIEAHKLQIKISI